MPRQFVGPSLSPLAFSGAGARRVLMPVLSLAGVRWICFLSLILNKSMLTSPRSQGDPLPFTLDSGHGLESTATNVGSGNEPPSHCCQSDRQLNLDDDAGFGNDLNVDIMDLNFPTAVRWQVVREDTTSRQF